MPNREKVISNLQGVYEYLRHFENTAKMSEWVADALSLLKEQQEIVRCISCTFYRSDGECALHNGRWKPEGFCSWAIRKEGR